VHATKTGPPFPASTHQVPIPFRTGSSAHPGESGVSLLERGQGAGLSDVELLNLLLADSGRCRTRERVDALLASAGIRDLARSGPPPWWRRLPPRARVRLAAALELARRLDLADGGQAALVQGPADVFEITADLRRLRREHFIGLYLNTRNRLLIRETISIGSLNASIVHPREVFEPALRQGAASLIVVHNHPSGETDPSEDDLAITRRLSEAGEILGVPLLDHVIVGGNGYTSLKENQALP
jgi:DNA repair protein RadC